jgi:iron complex transport system ATP-binding protein
MQTTSLLAIDLHRVGRTIGRKRILDEISWSIRAGSQAAVLGPNGSGKSTLLRLITGYLFPTDGTIDVLGRRLGKTNLHQLRRSIGLVDPAGPLQTDHRTRVLGVVLTGFFGNLSLDFDTPSFEEREAGQRALDQVGLADHADQTYRTLSTGEQRRTLLARAMVAHPRLLILDEPTAGLDLLARETFLATLDRLTEQSHDLTTLLVTHHLEELSPRTTDVMLLSEGRTIASGPPLAVLTSDNLSQAFHCPVTVNRHNDRWWWTVAPGSWNALLD